MAAVSGRTNVQAPKTAVGRLARMAVIFFTPAVATLSEGRAEQSTNTMSFFGSPGYSFGKGGRSASGYGYGGFDDDYGYEYGRYRHDEEDHEDITFIRPDGDTEGKSISWCKSNGFFEIAEGVWSGPWYYRQHPEEHPDKKFSNKCPVGGCQHKFKSEAELEKHLRMGTGKVATRKTFSMVLLKRKRMRQPRQLKRPRLVD